MIISLEDKETNKVQRGRGERVSTKNGIIINANTKYLEKSLSAANIKERF